MEFLLPFLIKCALACGLLYVLTLKLRGIPKVTPVQNGLWIAAHLSALGLLTSTHRFNQSDIDYYIGTIVLTIIYYPIGFVLGYVWRKFKPL